MRIVIWQIHIFMYVHCVTVQMTQADGVSKSEMYWLFRHAIALDGKLPRQMCSLLIAATQSYWQRIWKKFTVSQETNRRAACWLSFWPPTAQQCRNVKPLNSQSNFTQKRKIAGLTPVKVVLSREDFFPVFHTFRR